MGAGKKTIFIVVFALIATAANIGAQDIVTRIYSGPFNIAVSVVAGTGVGFVVNFIFDKRYIFRFRARSAAHHTQAFALYGVMGLITTAIFWGVEFGFHYIFETKEMRYLGAVIGLALGYLTRYQLNKRYVFRSKTA